MEEFEGKWSLSLSFITRAQLLTIWGSLRCRELNKDDTAHIYNIRLLSRKLQVEGSDAFG